MRPAQVVDYIRGLLIAFYRSISKLSINAHQLYAYWRIKINRANRSDLNKSAANKSSLGKQLNTFVLLEETELKTTCQLNTDQQQQQQQQQPQQLAQEQSFPSLLAPPSIGKTPNPKKYKFYSLFRRLSIRNFMEYCVIALNEASSSSCSNKFDLNSCESPVWLLGQLYDLPKDAKLLVDDIRSKLWITYRRNFPPIDENSRYTTDRGFGCMIRCGQMVLANALLCKNLGRNWRWLPNGGLELNPDVYAKILKLFQDKDNSVYSIHNIVKSGQQEGIVIGEWFGPNTIAQALKRISAATTNKMITNDQNDDELMISIDAALDNVVVIEEIKARFKQRRQKEQDNDNNKCNSIKDSTNGANDNKDEENGKSKPEKDNAADDGYIWVPGILFIQLRLGLSKINPLYFNALRKTFQFKNSLGIIGGRPNHALYLIGYTDNDIIYLDPHSTQQYIDLDVNSDVQQQQQQQQQQQSQSSSSLSCEDNQTTKSSPTTTIDSTYHCACPERMLIDRLDPSLALCFYFHTEQEFDDWCNLSNDLLIKVEQAPMFEITKLRPYGSSPEGIPTQLVSTVNNTDRDQQEKRPTRDSNNKPTLLGEDNFDDLNLKSNCSDTNEEEFEMLG